MHDAPDAGRLALPIDALDPLDVLVGAAQQRVDLGEQVLPALDPGPRRRRLVVNQVVMLGVDDLLGDVRLLHQLGRRLIARVRHDEELH